MIKLNYVDRFKYSITTYAAFSATLFNNNKKDTQKNTIFSHHMC